MTDDLHKRAEDAVTRLKDYENVYPGDEVEGELYLRAADVIAALLARLKAVTQERNAWEETALIYHKAETAFLDWLREAGEHMRAEGVTICDDGKDSGGILAAKVPECAALLKARAEEAEAERDDARKLQAKDFAVIDSPWKRRAEKAEAALAVTPSWLTNCSICGRVVDMREPEEGGDAHGCECSNGWACSRECALAAQGDKG